MEIHHILFFFFLHNLSLSWHHSTTILSITNGQNKIPSQHSAIPQNREEEIKSTSNMPTLVWPRKVQIQNIRTGSSSKITDLLSVLIPDFSNHLVCINLNPNKKRWIESSPPQLLHNTEEKIHPYFPSMTLIHSNKFCNTVHMVRVILLVLNVGQTLLSSRLKSSIAGWKCDVSICYSLWFRPTLTEQTSHNLLTKQKSESDIGHFSKLGYFPHTFVAEMTYIWHKELGLSRFGFLMQSKCQIY